MSNGPCCMDATHLLSWAEQGQGVGGAFFPLGKLYSAGVQSMGFGIRFYLVLACCVPLEDFSHIALELG